MVGPEGLWNHRSVPRHRFRVTTMHRGTDRIIAGVSSGVAAALRVDPIIVRVGFVVLSVAGGVGIPLYFVLWFLMPAPDGERPAWPLGSSRFGHLDLEAGDVRRPVAIGLIVAGTVLLFRNVGPWFSDVAVWPVTLAGFGVAVLWARSDDDERARLTQAAGRPLQAVLGGRQAALRLVIGAILVFAGIGAFLAANDALGAARQVGLAVAVTIAGLAVILGPWIRRLVTELGQERRERIRPDDRPEVAAHLHDSV
jgi:phage shock protein PspC (stress-responsive transcriptional regulator)